MKRIVPFCIFVLVSGLFASSPKIDKDPPIAVARLCGNVIITSQQREQYMHHILAQGCDNVRFDHIERGYYLAYGTKVLIAEK